MPEISVLEVNIGSFQNIFVKFLPFPPRHYLMIKDRDQIKVLPISI